MPLSFFIGLSAMEEAEEDGPPAPVLALMPHGGMDALSWDNGWFDLLASYWPCVSGQRSLQNGVEVVPRPATRVFGIY